MSSYNEFAQVLQALGHPARLQIMLAIGNEETCVCHLEAIFGWRQAYLSQHLMALREAGIVMDRRESRYIYYRIIDPQILNLLYQMAEIQSISLSKLKPSQDCPCPKCANKSGGSCE